ncbi:MAG: hypothetical protein K6G68_01785 [Oscillospiraceae bacterium]|nr:hypothetical protein [Oscillospiraceae bacterium]
MKKRVKVIIIVLICAVLFIPVPAWYLDGGTVKFTALTYSVTKQHSICSGEQGYGYNAGTRVRILFWTVYDDVKFVPVDVNDK